jgi:hypothetical protein
MKTSRTVIVASGLGVFSIAGGNARANFVSNQPRGSVLREVAPSADPRRRQPFDTGQIK